MSSYIVSRQACPPIADSNTGGSSTPALTPWDGAHTPFNVDDGTNGAQIVNPQLEVPQWGGPQPSQTVDLQPVIMPPGWGSPNETNAAPPWMNTVPQPHAPPAMKQVPMQLDMGAPQFVFQGDGGGVAPGYSPHSAARGSAAWQSLDFKAQGASYVDRRWGLCQSQRAAFKRCDMDF